MIHGPLGPQLDGPLYAHGFSLRKRAIARDFTARPDIRFVAIGGEVPAGAQLLLWGSAPVPAGAPQDARVIRVEDGFLRSVGLGADLTRPLSWVFDDVGIYYDATAPSSLEQLLQSGEFSEVDRERAVLLRQRIVEAGLTKYNLAAADWRPGAAPGQHVVLVPGQVETDASIAKGAVDIRTNIDLLVAVRRERPDAWIVYKPHPDVVAGLRGQGQGEARAQAHCDEVVLAGSMHQMLQCVDEVHVLTSLTGFEALLRGKAVTCWGQPFYSGWGLTEDRHVNPRRTRRLGLDELVAGTLLRYPAYLSRATQKRCAPEQVLDELAAWRAQAPAKDAWWRRLLRPLIARP